ncbi:MAG: hypothetical protein M3384_14860 [Acidobacteriota bacterium]|nr:hypothetical protein [Acidobacteriota bacterium]
MNGIIKIVIITATLTLSGGCSGASSGDANASPADGNSPVAANPAPVANTNTAMIPYPGTENTNGAPRSDTDAQVVNIDPKQLKPTSPAVPAADNSEVLTVLNEKGAVETRIFKSNPVLAKVEKTTFGRDVQLKVFLKNGKVVSLAPEKIGNFTADSAEQILEAAGIRTAKPVENADAGAATGTKTEETKESRSDNPSQAPNAPPVKAPTKP